MTSAVATLDVALVANTCADFSTLAELTGVWKPTGGGSTDDADVLSEFAGRGCYLSWDRPNPSTATTMGYIANILDHEHMSVLEHGSASFYIQGVSRSLTHELVRHRHFSPSQLSQRYVDESDARYVIPPAARGNQTLERWLRDSWDQAIDAYRNLVTVLEHKGLSRKEARQTARSVLPNMTETKLLVTGNHRSWREFLIKRGSAAADTEIRELAVAIYDILNDLAPAIYQDIQPFSINGKAGNIGLVQLDA